MNAPAQRTGRTDWLWDLAHVSAAALRRRPGLTWLGIALALAAAALAGPWLGVPLAVAVGLVAGGLARVRLPRAAWLALAVPPLVIVVAPLEIWMPGSPSWLAWPEGRASFAAMGALTGFVLTQRAADLGRAPLLACLLAGTIAFAVFGFDEPPLLSKSGIGAGAALLTAIVCLGALSVRGGWVPAWLALAAPSVLTSMSWQDKWSLAVATGGLLVCWAARTGRALRDGAPERSAETAATRLVILLQTRSWTSAFLVFATGMALAGFSSRSVGQAVMGLEYWAGFALPNFNLAAPSGGALALLLVFHASWAGCSGFGRLAVWVAAVVTPAALALPRVAHAIVTANASPLLILDWMHSPAFLSILALGLVLGRHARDKGAGPIGALLLLALVAAAPLVDLMARLDLAVLVGPPARLLYVVAWAALAHWLVVRRTSVRFLLRIVLPCGVLFALAQAWGLSPTDGAWLALQSALQWLVAIAVILAARRVRSMTAVPAEHPIVADWGVTP